MPDSELIELRINGNMKASHLGFECDDELLGKTNLIVSARNSRETGIRTWLAYWREESFEVEGQKVEAEGASLTTHG